MSEIGPDTLSPPRKPFVKLYYDGPVGALPYLLSLFGVGNPNDLPKRQIGEFNRLCELGMQSNTLEEFKQSIRADFGPPEPTYEDVVDAAAALRKRIDDDALRYLCCRFGCNSMAGLQHCRVDFRKFIQLSRLEASSPEEFTLAMADTLDDNWSRGAKAPLPDGLRVLALEYLFEAGLKDYEVIYVLNTIGCVSEHQPHEKTVFGPSKRKSPPKRIRVDVILEQSVLSQWLSTPEEIQKRFGFKRNGDLTLCGHKVLNSFAHRYEVGDEQALGFEDFWTGGILNDEHLNKDEPDQFTRWAKSAVRNEQHLKQFMHLQDACNGKIKAMNEVLDRQQYRAGPQQFLVEGLIPKSVPVLLLAKQKVGKTNAMLELAVAVARRDPQWFGFPLKSGHGFAVYLFGEGSREDAEERVRTMNGGELPLLLNLVPYDGTDIDAILKSLSDINIELLIVDPARKFYKGDEDGSDAVSEFFTKLEEFARRKCSAVVVTHHLKREAAPKSIHDVPRCMRGSQVFLDRPRVVLAMRRAGTETQFGIPAPDGQPLHNFRGSRMFSGIRRLRRDEATFQHVVLGTVEGKGPVATGLAETAADDAELISVGVGSSDLERIRAAVFGLINGGQRVTSRGKRELFKLNPLDGVSRSVMRTAIGRLESEGVLRRDPSGALVPAE
jgi:AAA domain-containing protein